MDNAYSAVVLAGERPGGSDFSRQLGLDASVLVDVAGKSALRRVIEALEASACVRGGVLCGPDEPVYRRNPEFGRILEGTSFGWMAPRTGPSASALAGIERLNRFPILLTAGDHALLTPAIVDDFCSRAVRKDADIVFGLAPYPLVREAFPETRRTVLKLRDGEYCGTNLFAVLNRDGMSGPKFWTRLEADRKRPWKMARRLGWGMLIQYLIGMISLEPGLQKLSRAIGCRLACVRIEEPRVAVDVDSVADRDLAVKILEAQQNPRE